MPQYIWYIHGLDLEQMPNKLVNSGLDLEDMHIGTLLIETLSRRVTQCIGTPQV